MNVTAIRPFFVRSSLLLGWLAAGTLAFALAPQAAPPAPPPIAVMVETAPELRSLDPKTAAEDEAIELPHDEMVSLALEVTNSNTACAYYSSFDVGAVELPRNAKSATLERDFDFMDGCHWRSTEQLDRVEGGKYRYTYRERAVSCRPGAHAATACMRSGFAIEDAGEE